MDTTSAIDVAIFIAGGVGVVGVPLLILWVFISMKLPESKMHDPQRMFTAEQRQLGFERAGGQCEYSRWGLWRCTRTAEHGDHYVPWSRGGATSMANFVAACPRCNTSKGARTPTNLEAAVLRLRRHRYFPAGIRRGAGERVRVTA